MKNSYLYIIVLISGASVLAVEILGTRVLGPFYGVSLFLWSALISITLLALSVGYAIGGRWADRGAEFSRLCFLMIGAGIWLLFIPWLKQPLLFLSEPLGLRVAVLVASFILFAPPLTLLGMVSPYAIRVQALSLDEVGRTAGNLYAISTVGSVAAALLTGFFLVPNVGVNRLIFLIGVVLITTAAFGLMISRNRKEKAVAVAALIIAASLSGLMMPSESNDPENGLIAVEQSAYADIRVVDFEGKRYFLIDGGVHTIVDPETWESHYPYAAVMDVTRDFFETPGNMLLIGLGGGTIVKNFAREGWSVDAVEIDPVVTKVAMEHFGLTESEGQYFHQDGRQFLINSTKKYDVIIMDAFGSSAIPFHLVTDESFGLIASRLKPNGVFAINMESNGWEGLILRSLTATLRPHFSTVMALPTYKETEAALGNMVMISANRLLHRNAPPQYEIPSKEFMNSIAYKKEFAWRNRFTPTIGNAPILTDDLNPVDLWSEEINHLARMHLHNFFEFKNIGL